MTLAQLVLGGNVHIDALLVPATYIMYIHEGSDYALFEMLQFFLLRAAMKMANIDAAFEYMFTNPRKSNGVGVAYIPVL